MGWGDTALQYIPPGGIFSRGGGHTPAGRQVRISVHRQGASTALIHVANDGKGIPSGQLGHIFERFSRGAARSRDNGGAGIGLTISKALIEAHSGTLTAASPRARSRSGVYLPPPAAPPRVPRTAGVAIPSGSDIRVPSRVLSAAKQGEAERPRGWVPLQERRKGIAYPPTPSCIVT